MMSSLIAFVCVQVRAVWGWGKGMGEVGTKIASVQCFKIRG